MKARGIEPHVAINGAVSKTGKARKTAVPPEVAASLRYAIERLRKRIEECFGWSKTVGGITQLKVRGLAKVRAVFIFAIAAYNIVRLPKLLLQAAKCVRRLEEGENNERRPRMSSADEPYSGEKFRTQPPSCRNAVTFSAAC